MLAIKLTADQKGILADDPQTGKQMILAYDPQTKTIGAILGVFDPQHGGIIPLSADRTVLGDYAPGGVLPALQSFKPVDYFAVTLIQTPPASRSDQPNSRPNI